MSQILRRSALMSLVTFAAAIVALVVIGFLASTASADEPHEPIVGSHLLFVDQLACRSKCTRKVNEWPASLASFPTPN
jgi:hypothetical protein